MNIKRIPFLAIILTFTLSSCQHFQPAELATTEHQRIANLTANSTIDELQTQMAKGLISAEQLTLFYLAQIAEKNPTLNAVIATNPKALAIARQLDIERKNGELRGRLHGIPILVKDNIETLEMPTTAGSLALANNHTRRDAPVIENLRQAGAIILGKTNLSEWANFRSTRSSSGWSGVGGQTRNPHDPDRSTCGSSSGSGAAVAANLAVAAIGTETDGSVTCPSSATGIVGIKPTVGLVSRTGIVPISHTQDTAGPMAKNVPDAAILLTAMQGKDTKDTATLASGLIFNTDYSQGLESANLAEKRIGVIFSPAMNHERVKALFEDLQNRLAKQQVRLVKDLKTSHYDGLYDDEFKVLMFEFKHNLNRYLKTLPNNYNQLSLSKLIEYNRANADQEMAYFQQEIFEMSAEKGPLDSPEYRQALAKIQQATRQQGLDKLINEHQLDAIISITLGPAWTIDQINGDHYSGGISSYSAISGYPHLTIPLGKVHGLPIGLSILGTRQQEKTLIEMAYRIEQLLVASASNNNE